MSDGPGDAPLAEVETAGGETLLLSAKEDGLRGRVRALWDLQSFYPKGVVVRRVEPDGAVRLSGGEALIRYKPFTPESWPRSLTQVRTAGRDNPIPCSGKGPRRALPAG